MADKAWTDKNEFKRLHGYSMMLYTGEAIALLASGVALSVAIHRKASVQGEPTVNASP